jgi:hypothetical protein
MVGNVDKAVNAAASEGARVDHSFLETVQFYSLNAHARRAGNGWGGQPIPNRTDMVAGRLVLIVKTLLGYFSVRHQ